MDCPKTIAVGLDAGVPTPHVLAEAKLLARTFGAELVFVHAIPEVPPLSPGFDILADQVRERFAELRETAVAEGIQVSDTFQIHYGAPDERILAVQEEVGANWIVIGAGAKSSLDRLLLGSTAESLLRTATVPVWVVRPGKTLADLDTILVAVDGSPAGNEALRGAISLARSFVASVRVLSVGEEAESQELLTELERWLDLHGVQVEFVSRPGEAQEGILAELEEHPADLLVLGHAGRRGFSRLLHGNTVESLTRKSPCSLLSLHAS